MTLEQREFVRQMLTQIVARTQDDGDDAAAQIATDDEEAQYREYLQQQERDAA